MKDLIINKKLQEELGKNGVIKVDLELNETKKLLGIYKKLHPQIDLRNFSSYYMSIFNNDQKYNKKVYNSSLSIIENILSKTFQNFEIVGIVYQIKGIGEESKVNIHQDLSITDEDNYSCLTIWIPLVESTEDNGALHFLLGSHKLFKNVRAQTLNSNLFEKVEDYIFQKSKIYEAELGSALVFNPATLHYSNSNKTEESRISISVSIVEKDAPIHIAYYSKVSKLLEFYKVPQNFWCLYKDFNKERLLRPAFGKLLNKIPFKEREVYERDNFIEKYERIKTSISQN